MIAETGAGQHGVATATACALLGLPCVVFMGEEDIRRQAPNVLRMHALGAEVRSVTSGTATLKDAVNEAMRDWVTNVETTHYVLGSAMGPHPYPTIVRDLQRRIGDEAAAQLFAVEGRLPDLALACVGGGSNAIGLLSRFIGEPSVRLAVAEAAGDGMETGRHAAAIAGGTPGILHGSRSLMLQDRDGQVVEAHSASAGLDYPGVGPQLAALAEAGRLEVATATDREAVAAMRAVTRAEGILPALETAHAVAALPKLLAGLEGSGAGVAGRGRDRPARVLRARRQGPGRARAVRRRRAVGPRPMTIDELRAFCLSLPGTHEKETWGDAEHAGDVTFRVKDKIYVMTGQDGGAVERADDDRAAGRPHGRLPGVGVDRALRRPVRLGQRRHRRAGRARSRGRARRHPVGLAPDDPEVDAARARGGGLVSPPRRPPPPPTPTTPPARAGSPRAFARARDEGRAALIPYVVAGYPDADASFEIACAAIDCRRRPARGRAAVLGPPGRRRDAAARVPGRARRGRDVRPVAGAGPPDRRRATGRPARADGLREPADRRRRRPGPGAGAGGGRGRRGDRRRPHARRGGAVRARRLRGGDRRRVPRRPDDVARAPRRRGRAERRVPVLRVAGRRDRGADVAAADGRRAGRRGEGGLARAGRRRLRGVEAGPRPRDREGRRGRRRSSRRRSSTPWARTGETSPPSARSWRSLRAATRA